MNKIGLDCVGNSMDFSDTFSSRLDNDFRFCKVETLSPSHNSERSRIVDFKETLLPFVRFLTKSYGFKEFYQDLRIFLHISRFRIKS